MEVDDAPKAEAMELIGSDRIEALAVYSIDHPLSVRDDSGAGLPAPVVCQECQDGSNR
jgi:hypothetical protein